MRNSLLSFGLVMLLVVGGLQSTASAMPQSNLDSEKYAVISAVIAGMYVGDQTKLVAIHNNDPCPKTSADDGTGPRVAAALGRESEKSAFKKMSGLSRETIDDFRLSV